MLQTDAGTHRTARRMPDILDVIAALSSDAIPTPPVMARAMLDLLPDDVWSDPTLRWLDPAAKSGSILREAAKRLMIGLEEWEPDRDKRAEHILRNMLYGCGITRVHAEMTRRSLYVSRDATSDHAIVPFDTPAGHVPFIDDEHDFKTDAKGRITGNCQVCGAPPSIERGDDRENYAYAFIHGAYPPEELTDMQFDVIVTNPPYQVSAKGTTRTMPVYNLFVERAIELQPKYVAMITPSRWFSGGLGLSDFRAQMIADRRLRSIVDNPKLFDCFPGVEIKGGVSYFLWDRDHDGDCDFATRVDGEIVDGPVQRDLRRGQGVLIRDNRAAAIVDKVTEQMTESLKNSIHPRLAFSDRFRTNFRGKPNPTGEATIPLIHNSGVGYVANDELEQGHDLIDKFKVLIPKASDGHGREVSYVLGEPIAVGPGSVCTESYFIAGAFENQDEALHFALYLTTKFVRFLVLQRKSTQDVRASKFKFVPRMDMATEWSDDALYEHFGLSDEERSYIDARIHPRQAVLSLDSPIPHTHRADS